MIEQWRKLVYKGHTSLTYSVSNLGKVRNDTTTKILRLQDSGYLHLRIPHDGCVRNIRVHRAVAETYLVPVEGSPVVNHINGNKHDNRVANLEWASQSHNVKSSLKARGRLINE